MRGATLCLVEVAGMEIGTRHLCAVSDKRGGLRTPVAIEKLDVVILIITCELAIVLVVSHLDLDILSDKENKITGRNVDYKQMDKDNVRVVKEMLGNCS